MSADLTGAIFRKSHRSGDNGACVEVAMNLSEIVAIRDSKDPNGAVLTFSHAEWVAFTNGVKARRILTNSDEGNSRC